eukprot:919243-Prorocentrum_minimum.AAC.1
MEEDGMDAEMEGGARSRRSIKPPERYKEAVKNLKLYCVCRKPYRQNVFMLGCDSCDEWYHGKCVGVEEDVSVSWASRVPFRPHDADELQEYVCAKCREKEANGTAEGNTEPEGMPITVLLQLQSYIKLCRTFQLSFVVCGFSHLRRVFQNLSSVPTAFAALSVLVFF